MKTVTLLPKFVISFFLLFVLPAATVLAQDYSYYYNGEKISFTPSPTRIAIRYKSEATMENKKSRLTQQGTRLQRPDTAANGLGILVAAAPSNPDQIKVPDQATATSLTWTGLEETSEYKGVSAADRSAQYNMARGLPVSREGYDLPVT